MAHYQVCCESREDRLFVHRAPLRRPQLADPGDEIVLEAAVNGRSKAIVTHNGRHFQPAAGKFDVQGVTPGAFLKRIKT